MTDITLARARRMTLGKLLEHAVRINPSSRAVALMLSWVSRGAFLARKPSRDRLFALLPLLKVAPHDRTRYCATRSGTLRMSERVVRPVKAVRSSFDSTVLGDWPHP